MSELAEIDKAIAHVLPALGYKDPKEYQMSIMTAYLQKKDAFLCAPCGSGKSLTFEAAPFLFQYMKNQTTSTDNIIIVVQPLIGLMKEQVEKMTMKNIKACYIGQEGVERNLRNGDYNIIFSSPEALLTKHSRKLLMSTIYQSNIKAIFVDESHCVQKWGIEATSRLQPFRKQYGMLGDVRSMLPKDTPMIALTATANKSTRDAISANICLNEPFIHTIAPNKDNIRYSKCSLKLTLNDLDDLQYIFSPIISNICTKKMNADRYLIFCHTTEHVTKLFTVFQQALKDDQYHNNESGQNDDRNRYFAQFHKTTDSAIKDTIISSFGDPNGIVRVLFATVAFGMGMDVKGLYNIIHIGAPQGIDDYMQESGRAGRGPDILQCHSLLIRHKNSTKKCDEDMRSYVNNNTVCRRKCINAYFDTNEPGPELLHNCCDICATSCSCQCSCEGACACTSKCIDASGYMSDVEHHIKSLKDSKINNCCFLDSTIHYNVSNAQSTEVRKELTKLKMKLADNIPEKCLFTGLDISTGYHSQLIDHIVTDLPYISSLDVLKSHFEFYNVDHANETYKIITNILTDTISINELNIQGESDLDVNAHSEREDSVDDTTSTSGSNISNYTKHVIKLQSTDESSGNDDGSYW